MFIKNKTLKTIFTIIFLLPISLSAYDVTDYVHTLDKQHSDGEISIGSGYNFNISGSSYSLNIYNWDGSALTIKPRHYSLGFRYSPSGPDYIKSSSSIAGSQSLVKGYYYVPRNEATNAHGGAVYVQGDWGNPNSLFRGKIDKLYADFIGSGLELYGGAGSYFGGGALANDGVIGNIYGDFVLNNIVNYNATDIFGGAIFNGVSPSSAINHIDNIQGNFVRNYVYSFSGGVAAGGAIANLRTIGTITGDFIANYAYMHPNAGGFGLLTGGAIYNDGGGTIGDINANFIGNQIMGGGQLNIGGAISNRATINNIKGEFNGNSVAGSIIIGGAIYNDGKIGNIEADFLGNTVNGRSYAKGGAIASSQEISAIRFAVSVSNWEGANQADPDPGADPYVPPDTTYDTRIENIKGIFVGNSAVSSGSSAEGGAIYNRYFIGNIEADFYQNYTEASGNALGGAIYNVATTKVTGIDPDNSVAVYKPSEIAKITGNFIDNHAQNTGTALAMGGAIYNTAVIGEIEGDFYRNFAKGARNAFGGAIYNVGDTYTYKSNGANIYVYVPSEIEKITGSFVDNYAQSTGTGLALGGAIYTAHDLTFSADGAGYLFSGNYTQDTVRGKNNNAIFVLTNATANPVLNFDLSNGGAYVFDDDIMGAQYTGTTLDFTNHFDINITGTGNDEAVLFNNSIINAENVTVTGASLIFGEGTYGKGAFLPDDTTTPAITNAVTNLSLDDASFITANDYVENIFLASYSASNDTYWHLDVDPDAMNADVMYVNGDVTGQTKLVIYPASDTDITGQGKILIVHSENDTVGTAGSFSVFRIAANPYLYTYDVLYDEASTTKDWYLEMNGGPGPGPVAPEVPPYLGLPAIASEQTRSMVRSVRNKVAANKFFDPDCCGVYHEYFVTEPVFNVWANPVYFRSESKQHLVDWKAEIGGMEIGIDKQFNAHNKLGVFLSYRNGTYDFSGKGRVYSSTYEAKTYINSFLGGLYYRYDKSRLWLFATLYGGYQDLDIRSDDGTRTDTGAIELGASAELGYLIPLNAKGDVTLEPILGLFYSQLDIDDVNDDFAKTASYGFMTQLELEAALKLEKIYKVKNGHAKLYFKPALLRPITMGADVTVTNLGKFDAYEDKFLGRVEVGGRYSLTQRLSTYASADYTFTSGYKAFSALLGLSYSFGKGGITGRPCYDTCPCEEPAPLPVVVLPKLVLPVAYFAFDKDVLYPEGEEAISKFAQDLKTLGYEGDTKIAVTGHTDNRGPHAYNVDLSFRRARTVAKELAKYDFTNVEVDGKSFDVPVAPNTTREGRAKNRRVEVEIKQDEDK